MLTVATIRRWLSELAPEGWAEDWDNVGLMVGRANQPVHKIALALDPTLEVVSKAIEEKADLLITHHPLLFKPAAKLELDRGVGEVVGLAVENKLAVYSLHTNLDLAPKGLADFLARKLGLENVKPACIRGREKLYKLVTFVPPSHKEAVRSAVAEQGAGWIGNYSDTSFSTPGTGTFKGQEGTDPFLGKQGELTQVQEERLETVVEERKWPQVREAMLAAHPYEEVAYDLYLLAEPQGEALAFARIGTLKEAVSLAAWAERTAELLGTSVQFAGDPDKEVRKVAVIPGSCGSLWQGVTSCDCLVTGEIGYHHLLELKQAGKAVVVLGHYGSESCFSDLVREFLQPRLEGASVEMVSLSQSSPWQGSAG
ncbi:MAG: Nif3-like dinuclear metal center hexameric protein [Firmicutes bacterium]|nr:Nif3-like dinuclear metal center hexameric protein [Bacillota bacterium]HQD39579.1 Nif3-like dinuclear metal center hexameric protein [Bacillota bacterium]